jgi:hypothetical protein
VMFVLPAKPAFTRTARPSEAGLDQPPFHR